MELLNNLEVVGDRHWPENFNRHCWHVFRNEDAVQEVNGPPLGGLRICSFKLTDGPLEMLRDRNFEFRHRIERQSAASVLSDCQPLRIANDPIRGIAQPKLRYCGNIAIMF